MDQRCFAQDVGWVHKCFPAPILQGGFATSLDPPAENNNTQCMERTNHNRPWRRAKRLHIRVTSDEKKQLIELANEHGLTVSDFVRVTITRSTPATPKAKPDRALFIRLLAELGKVGSNVNQIAHVLNSQRLVGGGLHVADRIIGTALSSVKILSDQLLRILQDGSEG